MSAEQEFEQQSDKQADKQAVPATARVVIVGRPTDDRRLFRPPYG